MVPSVIIAEVTPDTENVVSVRSSPSPAEYVVEPEPTTSSPHSHTAEVALNFGTCPSVHALLRVTAESESVDTSTPSTVAPTIAFAYTVSHGNFSLPNECELPLYGTTESLIFTFAFVFTIGPWIFTRFLNRDLPLTVRLFLNTFLLVFVAERVFFSSSSDCAVVEKTVARVDISSPSA